MRSHALARRPTTQVKETFWSSGDLLHELQATLAALADIECRYERDWERIEQWPNSEAERARLRAERESRHSREREPYVGKLDTLQQRMRAHLTAGL
ncbi:hypothetical protein [Microvirga massiliensis]|uniref:hypothetical protein n=1 Tax=Microvirga massiliensis TaxID=1033741 RepID=UPI00065FE2B9|nr:hypothetical protein [Microvirga massiliensis]